MSFTQTSKKSDRWIYLENIFRNPGAFTDEDFDTSDNTLARIERMKLLWDISLVLYMELKLLKLI